ncbi:MAG TPA: hypothetical protein VI456_05090 [Polyangia bacterium]
MRLFVALGIVVVLLLLLAAKITRHHRRVAPPPEPEEAESATESLPPVGPSAPPPPAHHAWSGPTLRDLLDKASGPAVIRGQARGPEGAAISVRASLAGRRERGRRIRVERGEFQISGLLFGRSYDLTFDGPNLRTTTLRAVTAPADGVEATLDPLPVLRGAIGFPSGGVCPYERVALRTGEAEGEDLVEIGLGDTCRFELTVPDGPTQMVLVATGDAEPLEMPVSIPPVGDPEPVCLNPPCGADPLAGTARLRIAFEGPDHADLSATLTFADGDRSSSYSCFTSGGNCELEALPTGLLFKVDAESSDCASAMQTIVLHAGANDLSLSCEPTRSITAVVKDLGETDDEDEIVVQ